MEALEKHYLGVIPDIPDPRDYFVTATPGAYPLPIVMPETRVLDQGQAGRCNTKCDQSGAELAFARKMSDNLVYGDNVGNVPGTSPRGTAQYMIDVGMPAEVDDPCNQLETPTIKSYLASKHDRLVEAAKPYRFEKYAFLHTVDEIKAVMVAAQKLKGLYIKFTMPYDGSSPDKYGFWDIKNMGAPTGYHEVKISACEMHACSQGSIETVKVKNSWGELWGSNPGALGGVWNGHGFFWTDWDGVLKLDAVIAVWPYEVVEPEIEGVTFHKSIRLKDTRMTDADTNGEVSYVQQRLVVYGYKVDVDGIYGPLTENAVRAFQLVKGLTVDGVVGPITWAALAKDPDQENPQPDNDPDLVAALKASLKEWAYGALGCIYVWSGQGQTTITESIIKAKETSDKNATRAIDFWIKQKAAGLTNLRMFDCSGLIARWLMDHNLSKVDLNCDDLYALCDPVSFDDLQPCDLIFRGSATDKTHVALYMGDGKEIEAKGRDDGVVCRGIYADGKDHWTFAGRPRCLK